MSSNEPGQKRYLKGFLLWEDAGIEDIGKTMFYVENHPLDSWVGLNGKVYTYKETKE